MVRDDNDRLRDGDLPDDPTEGTEPYSPEPRATDDSRARVARGKLSALLPDVLAELEDRRTGKSRPLPLSAWPQLAKVVGGGLWPGFYCLVGNTGSGKSAFALDVALEAAKSGSPVLYIALELDQLGILARLLTHPRLYPGNPASRLHWGDLTRGRGIDSPSAMALADPVAMLESLHIHVVTGESFNYTAEHMRDDAVALRAMYPEAKGRCLVVLDFLQLVGTPEGARMDLRERIGQAAYVGRELARDQGMAVLALSSTARNNYDKLTYGEGGPDKGDPGKWVGMGKESGEIEFACDGALALAVEGWAGDTPPESSRAWLAVAKQRSGPKAWIPMRFHGGRTFTEGEQPAGNTDKSPRRRMP